MGKHHISKRLSLPDTKSMDYKSRKRIEELYLMTNGIVNGPHMNYEYDYKLYRKYKQLKEINKKLQEKIINQHCSGCKCHDQLNEDTDESVIVVDSRRSTKKENKKRISSSNNNKKTERSSSDELEEEEEEQMDTTKSISKPTTDDQIMEAEEGDGLSNLPSNLQDIIKTKVKQSKTDNKYLLKLGLYPALCELLCDTSVDSLHSGPPQQDMRSFILQHVKHVPRNYMKIHLRVKTEIRDIHQLYMLEFYKDQQREESKANRKKEHQRVSL